MDMNGVELLLLVVVLLVATVLVRRFMSKSMNIADNNNIRNKYMLGTFCLKLH